MQTLYCPHNGDGYAAKRLRVMVNIKPSVQTLSSKTRIRLQ